MILLLLLAFACSCALGCAEWFPNMMLVGGDAPMLTAPVARFADELDRLKIKLNIAKPSFPLLESTNDLRETTRNIDLADLRSALKKRGDTPEEIQRIIAKYTAERERLVDYSSKFERWSAARRMWEADTNIPAPEFPSANVPAGLPEEFADYFRGAIVWHGRNTNAARVEWEKLLERPASERRYKSIWAAMMLGRSFEKENPSKAVGYYALVRALAAEGLTDSLGLAAASIGWQARAHLNNKEVERAIELYLQQLAMGDVTAYNSLRTAARLGLRSPEPILDSLAKNPRARAVITALVISTEPDCGCCDNDGRRTLLFTWLLAVERANVTDVESAEQLALANYQSGRFDLAERWLKRAPDSPVSQWLHAKLLLRAGKVDRAVKILAEISRQFPVNESTNSEHAFMCESLYIPQEYGGPRLNLGQQVLGELGVLHLHRHEYVQSLDALLHAGFWVDAAYVAERVLTADELKTYVDNSWPEVVNDGASENLNDNTRASTQSHNIRYLLARRLARQNRAEEACNYYPKEWCDKFQLFLTCLNAARDVSQPRAQRITNFYTAAFLIRSNGMEMIGTEVQPDFTCWAGNWECGPNVDERTSNAVVTVTGATHDELERAKAHGAEPDERWHYRYYAPPLRAEGAKLRFEEKLDTAKLLPNNTDETAMALYKLGKEAPDLQSADIVYKMLVRRCRKTELGDAADRQRWFPPFDANGKPYVTRKPKPVAPQ
jgi:tetratricopeptide (TPR) repeat protein